MKEIQNGFLDSDSKLNFQDKHNMSSNKHKGQFRRGKFSLEIWMKQFMSMKLLHLYFHRKFSWKEN